MDHIEYLTSLCDLKGLSVVDVGAGKGHFARQLLEHGALVTGIEIDADKVALAQARMPAGACILEGRGEALPLADASQDLACFMFSFHHIPIEVHHATIAETLRVLRPVGRLHVVEPLAENCVGDPMSLVDDETFVRTRSHALMQALPEQGAFELVDTAEYSRIYAYDSFDKFVDSIVRVAPERAERVAPVRDEMERLFNEKAIIEDGRFCFDDPCRAYHFRRV